MRNENGDFIGGKVFDIDSKNTLLLAQLPLDARVNLTLLNKIKHRLTSKPSIWKRSAVPPMHLCKKTPYYAISTDHAFYLGIKFVKLNGEKKRFSF